MIIFRNRIEAARQLADQLQEYRGLNPLIRAIPGGAVPMGRLLAQRLKGQLDVVFVHKIGAPGNRELAIGAVSESGEIVLGEQAEYFSVSKEYIEQASREELDHLKTRRRLFSPYLGSVSCRDRLVILVDDEIATGQTMLAAVKATRAEGPSRIVVAVPVAAAAAYAALAPLVDERVVLEVTPEFDTITRHYINFPQVTDEDAVKVLAGPNR